MKTVKIVSKKKAVRKVVPVKPGIKPISQQPTTDLHKKATGKTFEKAVPHPEVVPPVAKPDRMTKIANGDPGKVSTQAAKRVLTKRDTKSVDIHDKAHGYPLPDPRTDRIDGMLKAARDEGDKKALVFEMNARARIYVKDCGPQMTFRNDREVDKQVRTDFATLGGNDKSVVFTPRVDNTVLPDASDWDAYKLVEPKGKK